ncbi:hypothetical protein BROUX41_006531 [Berkeleyomyces rouxiae]|uniref:uncharacterized protein n=1 Tax=Berkeleyomyces rouxiae TaxID=2035830 RepID=UPI003B8288F1
MCKPASCATCHQKTWWGCGAHIAMVMDSIPEAERCQCTPTVSQNGKEYPPKAKSPF